MSLPSMRPPPLQAEPECVVLKIRLLFILAEMHGRLWRHAFVVAACLIIADQVFVVALSAGDSCWWAGNSLYDDVCIVYVIVRGP